jgi:hypothetical protein
LPDFFIFSGGNYVEELIFEGIFEFFIWRESAQARAGEGVPLVDSEPYRGVVERAGRHLPNRF